MSTDAQGNDIKRGRTDSLQEVSCCCYQSWHWQMHNFSRTAANLQTRIAEERGKSTIHVLRLRLQPRT